MAPWGGGVLCFFALAGLNLAINAMVTPGLGFTGETWLGRRDMFYPTRPHKRQKAGCMRIAVSLLFMTGLGVAPIHAQEGFKPAPVIDIGVETIKEGKSAAHEKVETEFAATLRKAGFAGHYYGMASMSGMGQVWWIEPLPSFAAFEEYQKFTARDPLKSSLDNLDSRDGDLRSSFRQMWAVYRSDLSYKPASCNVAKTRYADISTFRIKLGKDDDLVGGAKVIFDAYGKGNIDMCLLGYQVVAGAPSGTFLFVTLMDSMTFLDDRPARAKAMVAGMGESTYRQLTKGMGDLFVSMEDNLFVLKPDMSLAPPAVMDADPAFWKPKAAAKEKPPVSVPGPPEKKEP